MIQFDCEGCGIVDHILVDGYDAGDRLLEGVMFKVSIHGDELRAKVTKEHEKFFSTLNTKHWLQEIADNVEHHFEDCVGQCPRCGKDTYYGENTD